MIGFIRRRTALKLFEAECEKRFREQLNTLRRIEEEELLPRFDEATLPSRLPGELAHTWRVRQLDAIETHVESVLATLESPPESGARMKVAS